MKKRKKKVDGSWDEKKIVENGWSSLIESKKLTTTSVDKIKKYRRYCVSREYQARAAFIRKQKTYISF